MKKQPRSRLVFAWMALLLPAAAAPAWAQTGNGLVGEYYQTDNFTGAINTVRFNEPAINYNFMDVAVPGTTLPSTNYFSIRWRGQIEAPFTETFTFYTTVDDNARLVINGTQVIANGGSGSGTIALTAGSRYDFMLEFREFTGNASVRLEWSSPSLTRVDVPQNRFYSPTAVPATPTIAPNGGITPQSVALSTTTAGASIYYTLDGSDPGLTNPATGTGILWTGTNFNVTTYTKVRARAYLGGVSSALLVSNQFSPSYPVVAAPATSTPGLYLKYFWYNPGNGLAVDFDATIPPGPPQQRAVVTAVTNVFPGRDRNDNFSVIVKGYLTIPTAGLWTFYTNSDDGSRLYIDGVWVVDNDGYHGNQERSGQIALDAGLHTIESRYFEGTGGTEPYAANWEGPGQTKAVIPTSALSTEAIVATPTFSPAAPATFATSQTVTISCATPGALIYYTTDGSAPDARLAEGVGYSGMQVTLGATTRIRALAYATGMNPSAISSATYTQTGSYPQPSLVIASGINTDVVVSFDRPVTAATAGNFANYTINNGVTVSAATVIPKTGTVVGQWSLNADPLVDSTGANANGSLVDGAVIAGGLFAPVPGNTGSLFFDGVNDYATIPDGAALEVGDDSFTVTAWILPTSINTNKRIVNKWDNATNGGQGWHLDLENTTFRFRLRDTAGRNLQATFPSSITANAWSFVSARFDAERKQLSVFHNGVPLTGALVNDDVAIDDLSNAAVLAFGSIPSVPGNWFAGNIDEVKLWRIALSNEDIRAMTTGVDTFSSSVRLTTSAIAPALTHTLTVQNVTDHFGVAMPAGGLTRNFRYLPMGTVRMEFFATPYLVTVGDSGGNVTDFTRKAIYPYKPTSAQSLTVFENNTAQDDFGARTRGYFVPNATGSWRLASTSDDAAQLWLSTNEDPANKILISRNLNWGDFLKYDDADIRQSVPIPLVAGQKYYIEQLFKEGGGGDHMSVAAIPDGGIQIPPDTLSIPATMICPIEPLLTIVQQPRGLMLNAGGTGTLTVAAQGTAPLTYQWRRNGVNLVNGGVISGATSSTLTLTGATLQDSGYYDVIVTDVYGNITSATAVVTVIDVAAAPTLSAVAPATGRLIGGDLVTLTGTNFIPGALKVSFGGLDATGIVFVSTTSVTCLIPPHAAGLVDVVVTTPAGPPATLVGGFTYLPPPTISSINTTAPAAFGPYGPIGGTNTVTITGTNFVNGATTVKFGSGDATSVVVTGTTSLTCVAPDNLVAGVVDVSVSDFFGTVIATGGYEYVAAPTAVTILPTDGPVGGGQAFTLTGTNLIPGYTTVNFATNAATGVTVAGARTSLTGTTPAGSVATVAVTVVAPGGTSGALPGGYTYHPVPTASGMVPASGPTLGGTSVTITGTGFASGLTSVTFGGTAGTGVTVGGGGTTITVTTPSHLPGDFDVVVTTPGGPVTVPGQFTYSGPFITSVTNSAGPAIGGDTVTIVGVGFTGVTDVRFGGSSGIITSSNATQIVVTTPFHAAGPVLVEVLTPGGNDDLPNGYTFYDPPTLTSVTLNQGPALGGQTVTLAGTNFVQGFTTVMLGGTAATGVTVGGGGTSLTCVTPLHAAGLFSVDVATFVTQVATLSNSYTFIDPPTVASIMPTRGSTLGGQTVTITGSNFVDGQTTVLFGIGSATGVTVASGGASLTCTTPAGAGTVSVQVTTFGLQPAALPNSYTFVNSATLVDLGITLTADNATPALGDPVVLTAVLTNVGALGGVGIVVRELLPAGITFVAASPTQGTYDSATGLWNVGSVGPAGGTATLLLSVLVNTTSAVTVTAEVTACTPDDVDSTVNNSVTGEDDQASVTFQTAFQINSPAALPSATTGAYYWQPLQIQGGAPPYVWTLVSGSLPFNLDPVTGIISGIAPAPGVYPFTLSVSDSDGPPSSLTQAFSITVNPANGAAPTVNASPVPPDGVVGTAYDFTFTAVDSAPPYTWTLSVPALPGGLTLNSRTGRLAGTPTAAGVFNFTIQAASGVQNGSRAFTITIAPPALSFRTLSLPNAAVGQFYTQQVELEGGLGPTFTWSLSAGTLPTGLSLTGNTRSATLSGTPLGSGPSTFTLQAIDGGPSGATVTRSFSITTSPAAGLAFEVTTTSLPRGTQGRAYSAQLNSRGGTGLPSWSLASGQLPAGLSLSNLTGQISGTPTASGRYEIVVQGSAGSSDTQALTLDVAPAPQITTPATLPSAIQGEPYALALEVSGGQAPFTWTSTTLPASGISLNAYSGVISGAPPGAVPVFDVTVTDVNGATDTVNFTLTVLNPAAIVLLASPPDAQVGVPYSTTLTALGGTPAYAYSVIVGTLPAGLSLDPLTGVISGTPTVAGAVLLTFQVTGGGTATAGPLTLTVNAAALSITPLSAPGADPGVPFTMTLTALNASGAVTWQIVEGSLPAGLSLDSATGILSGTPFSSGTFFFRVRATDAAGNSAERRYTMGVAPGAAAAVPGAAGSGSEGGSSCSLGSAGADGVPWTLLALAAMIAAAAWIAGRRAA